MRIWKRLLGLALCLCAAVCVMSVSASAAEHSHPICGETHTDIGDHTGPCNAVEWIKVTQEDVTPNNGLILKDGKIYYLGDDIKVKWDITIKGTVNLCLNGHSITKTLESTNNMGVITVEPGSSFTLCDCNGSGAGNGNITHADGKTGKGVLVGSSSSDSSTTSFIMYGGTISGNRTNLQDGAGVRVQSASFKMYGGTITDNHVEKVSNDGGGGVAVSTSGKFIMHGGEISRNTSNGDCGGVAVVGSSFQMYGGSIINNNATNSGGGVGLWNDSFRLSGGTISGNTAKDGGGGVYFSANSNNILTISDTVKIEGNTAANGGGVYLNTYNLTVTGGSISGNTATGSGGGVYFAGSSFNVSGDVNITGNMVDSSPNNIYLPDGKIITVGGALNGSDKIGVTTENTPNDSNYVRIALGNKDYTDPEKFLYENDGAIAVSAVVSGSTATLVACQHNWTGAWTTDDTQHWKECSICKGKNDVSGHNYDEMFVADGYKKSDANCKSPAVYYKSCVCGAKGTETFESGDKNPDKHSGALGGWQSNEDKHWKEYSCCHAEAEKGEHTWDEGEVTETATCTTTGVKTYTCSVCLRTRTEDIQASGHDYSVSLNNAAEPTCTADGKETDMKCSRCNIVETGKTIPKLGHDPIHHDAKAAACTEIGWDAYDTCSRCDYTTYKEIAALGHDFEGGTYQHDESQHWKKCSRCDAEDAKAAHNFSQNGRTYTCTDCGYSYTVSSGGGSSTITVPVTGSRDTVKISASVSGSTVTVKEIWQDELDKIGTDSDVVIDLAGLGKSVTGVTLPGGTIDSISDSAADGVTIKLPGAQLRLDRQTLTALAEQTSGRDVRLVVETDAKAKSTMNSAQKQALDGMKNAAAIEAYFVSNGTRIYDFNGGQVELTIPYQTGGAIRGWYLKEDGTREQVSAVYDKENARLTLRHFSHYVIEELEAGMAYAACPKDGSCPIAPYTDAAPTAWYHDGVHYCIDNGLMQGVSSTQFLPDGSTTRAQLVTILWRLEGAPAARGDETFLDAADGAWYTAAVRWAAGEGIVRGYGDGHFGPDDAVTREQMVAILYRFAQYKGADVSVGGDTNILSFSDAAAVSEYAVPAMQWACGSGLVAGVAQEGRLALVPKGTTTRAQAATLMMRFQSIFVKNT